MTNSSLPRTRAFRNFLAISGSLGLAVYFALETVDEPLTGSSAANPSPYGYTISLALFLVPLAALAWWFYRHRECRLPERAFTWTIGLLIPLGFILDLLFANTFFRFPNHHAVLGACVDGAGTPLPWKDGASLLCIPARGGVVPVEEFVFYLTGFMVVLLTYIWADEYWLKRYNVADYKKKAEEEVDRIVKFHSPALLLGAMLIAVAFVTRRIYGTEIEGGFPAYACYLITVSIVPSVGLFKTAREFINWRAFNFTFFLMLLVCVIWEVTLAKPYGWWDYNPKWMIGVPIKPWFDLPLDAVFVWLAVTFTTVIVYEVVKVWLAMEKSMRRAFLG